MGDAVKSPVGEPQNAEISRAHRAPRPPRVRHAFDRNRAYGGSNAGGAAFIAPVRRDPALWVLASRAWSAPAVTGVPARTAAQMAAANNGLGARPRPPLRLFLTCIFWRSALLYDCSPLRLPSFTTVVWRNKRCGAGHSRVPVTTYTRYVTYCYGRRRAWLRTRGLKHRQAVFLA
jgi:hypothetical protein